MPPIFYRQAHATAAGRALDVAVFETWEQLAKALDKLTPEQRCDAVDADWLLQLHSLAHQALLQRKLHEFYQLAMPAAAAQIGGRCAGKRPKS